MAQLQNVQRGTLFAFFIYSVIIFVFTVIKLVQNKIDIDSGDEDGGQKYKEGLGQNKDKNNTQHKQQKPVENKPEQTMQELGKKVDSHNQPKEDDTLVTKVGKKLHHHVLYHLPLFFPFAISILTGSTYGFLFFLFFAVQVCFGLFNDLKIHLNCVQNRIIKIILQHIGIILTFFVWVNQWASNTADMPYAIKKG